MFKREGDKETPEPFAEMAKFFTESRLLQQEVKLLIEGVSNQLVIATIIHPVGYITLVCTCMCILWCCCKNSYSTKLAPPRFLGAWLMAAIVLLHPVVLP